MFRVANTVRLLRERGYNYVLVLPPWGGLYHWKKAGTKLPWSLFFDVSSINQLVPVVEFEQYLKDTNNDDIDEVIYLQGYAEGWSNGHYEIKYDKRECIDGNKYYALHEGKWRGWFFSYSDVRALAFSCVSIQGDSNTLADLIERNHSSTSSIFIDRAETILHSRFGDSRYWQARRAMRYAKHLVKIGNQFRSEKFGSNDLSDRTVLDNDWESTVKKHGDALGGDFICAHWRRRDFVRSHAADIPSIEGTARIITKILKEERLNKVFLSTDAHPEEVAELRKWTPPDVTIEQFLDHGSLSDGEISIIDQWICAHARYFTGTHVSTFSYRIQEDREILGFRPETTFNRLCPDEDANCEQPAKWKIVYEDSEMYDL
ncbi:unnamed protein product [Toxocara canis]|uniref:GDP-fucose protein O-fucosyltransferase 2 n=1 Tax=Toxocara canis TaxID=6265 RepID=A0A183U0F1_TOXCA|nr:unnamed protein product [Toxocara canis]